VSGFTANLAERAVVVRPEALRDEQLERVRQCVLDWIAVTVAEATLPLGQSTMSSCPTRSASDMSSNTRCARLRVGAVDVGAALDGGGDGGGGGELDVVADDGAGRVGGPLGDTGDPAVDEHAVSAAAASAVAQCVTVMLTRSAASAVAVRGAGRRTARG